MDLFFWVSDDLLARRTDLEVVVARSVRNFSLTVNAGNQRNPFLNISPKFAVLPVVRMPAAAIRETGRNLLPEASGFAPGADTAPNRRPDLRHNCQGRPRERHACFRP